MPSKERTSHVSVRTRDERGLPGVAHADPMPSRLIEKALKSAGIAKEDSRYMEFWNVAENVGPLAVYDLLALDTVSIRIKGNKGTTKVFKQVADR